MFGGGQGFGALRQTGRSVLLAEPPVIAAARWGGLRSAERCGQHRQELSEPTRAGGLAQHLHHRRRRHASADTSAGRRGHLPISSDGGAPSSSHEWCSSLPAAASWGSELPSLAASLSALLWGLYTAVTHQASSCIRLIVALASSTGAPCPCLLSRHFCSSSCGREEHTHSRWLLL